MPNTAKLNLMSLMDQFGDDNTCREYIEKLRWPSGVACPRCGDLSVSEISTRDQFDCNGCRYRFSVTSGTIFDNTKLPLRKWFVAIYLMLESKKGISANQMKRTLGVSYKTAWHLCHRIREAMEGGNFSIGPTLFGIVEVDETLVGGKREGVGTGNTVGKHWVVGAVQRGGNIRLEAIPNVRKATLHDFIFRHVSDETEAIYTDELRAYLGIADHNTRHQTVKHIAKEWVTPDGVHTNTVEGVWSLLKRSIMGAFHKVSVKHLNRYLEELEWRFNNRDNEFMFRDLLTRLVEGEALRYHALTS
ncbi:MAG: IS1595 family transposase [Gemmatimonadota bacterium]